MTSAHRFRLAALLLVSVALLSSASGRAEEPPQLRYRVFDRVLQGARDQRPGIEIAPAISMKDLRLDLKRQDGERLRFDLKRIAAGRTKAFHWKQPPGRMTYQAALTASDLRGHRKTLRFEFEILVVEPLAVHIDADRLDVAGRRIVFRANRPLEKVELTLIGDSGELDRATRKPTSSEPNAVQELQWPETEAEVRQIVMRVHDVDGFWSEHTFSLWWMEVEHDEVHFDTGKATFAREEAAKLDASLAIIQDVLAKHSKVFDLRLYVAGYTDTVGSVESNLKLSEARARAIANYLRKRGLKIPVFYQGFGEGVLAAMTEDEVDEARNRRAIYVLGTSAPPTSAAIPRAAWKKL